MLRCICVDIYVYMEYNGIEINEALKCIRSALHKYSHPPQPGVMLQPGTEMNFVVTSLRKICGHVDVKEK